MNYLKLSVWIFLLLIFLIILLFLFPSNLVIGLGLIGLPLLVILQVIIVLRAKDESNNSFSDKWYDK